MSTGKVLTLGFIKPLSIFRATWQRLMARRSKSLARPRSTLTSGAASYIPNEGTYLTWFESFASVRTVTDGQLALYEVGEAVSLKAGALVSIDGSSKILCRWLRWQIALGGDFGCG